jgi:hypothetical protein
MKKYLATFTDECYAEMTDLIQTKRAKSYQEIISRAVTTQLKRMRRKPKPEGYYKLARELIDMIKRNKMKMAERFFNRQNDDVQTQLRKDKIWIWE